MMEKENNEQVSLYETGVIHGRFQIVHLDHLKYLLSGKALCRHLVVGITNPDPLLTVADAADPARSLPAANPLTYYERAVLIRLALGEAGMALSEFTIVPFPINRPELYHCYLPLDAVFFLSIYDGWGAKKREFFQKSGLNVCVLRDVPIDQKGISATSVREAIINSQPWEHLVPESVAAQMKRWNIPERLKNKILGQ
jgi:nicotinamide mononucleotide adenylyltransferase